MLTHIIKVCVMVIAKVIAKPTNPAGKVDGIMTTNVDIDPIIMDDKTLMRIVIHTGTHVFARKYGTS